MVVVVLLIADAHPALHRHTCSQCVKEIINLINLIMI
jgi:hypothetical protein